MLLGNVDIKKAKTQFYNHRARAQRKNIEFLLSFDEWLKFWLDSGFYFQKGTHSGQYVMSRFNDIGPYKLGNIKIQTVEDNSREAFTTTNFDFIKPKYGKDNSFYGQKHTSETKEKCRKAAKEQLHTPETNKKTSDTLKKLYIEEPWRRVKPKNKHCIHCDRLFDAGNFARYHGDKCKLKKT